MISTMEVKVNKKKASSTLYFIFFFVIFLAFCAFAVDGTIVFTNRAKLQSITETTALSAAEEFNYDKDATASQIEQKVKKAATDLFNVLKQDSLKYAIINDPNVVVYTDGSGHYTSGNITVVTNMVSQPFFLSFLGVSGINLSAQAKARSAEMPVYGSNTPNIHWATKRAVYQADVISNDSAVLKSLLTNASLSYSSSGKVNYKLIRSSAPDPPLSLGPGGFVTIKLPVPIIDKDGYDLYISESGDAKEGYMVFAGLDNNPNNPYIDYKVTGDGLSWVNISCTGDSKELANPSYQVSNTNLKGIQTKFYGSGYFDISRSCPGYNSPVSMIKYIRIVDDNSESAFVKSSDGIYYKSMLYGESSTNTPGADIDSVKVLNHVQLTQ